jgi:hypothetical protein
MNIRKIDETGPEGEAARFIEKKGGPNELVNVLTELLAGEFDEGLIT